MSGRYDNRDRSDRGGGGYNQDRRGHQGGGGNRGGDHNQEQYYQRSFVGKKRGRDEEPQPDPRNVIITRLMALGDRQQGAYDENMANEAIFEDMLKLCKREISYKSDAMVGILLDCIAEICTKTPHYALLTGLLNVDEHDFVAKLLEAAQADFDKALTGGDMARARLLLRFFASLVVVNVVHPSGVLSLMDKLVDCALSVARSAGDSSGLTWQLWSDQLVYLVVAALPWSGGELSESSPAEVTRLMESIDAYMEARPIKFDDTSRPFFGSRTEDDQAAKSDSGAASFLPEFWAAVRLCQQDGWKVTSVPQLHGAFEAKLATATSHELQGPELVPCTPPFVPADVAPAKLAALLRKAFPARGGMRLLDAVHTEGSRAPIERWVAEEFLLDTLASFDGNRVECVRRLMTGMPMPWLHRNMLAEVLFAQMLALPHPRLHPLAYSTVMVDLCKVPKFEFPKALSACVRELFARVPFMDPEVRTRLVNWLSYHLSNFEYQWPWDRWVWVMEQPVEHPQRQFCQELLARLIRLSFWDRISQGLPEKFKELLGPAPEVPELPGAGAAAAVAPAPAPPEDAAAANDAAEGAAAADPVVPAAPSREMVLSGELLALVRAKASCDEALDWLEDHVTDMDTGEEGGGAKDRTMLQIAARALLAAGSKSPSHLNVALERYARLLDDLLRKCGGKDMQQVLLVQAASFYQALPQKVLMVVDRLMSLQLVEAGQVVRWALGSALPDSGFGAQQTRASSAWEVLYYAIDRSYQRLPELREKVARQAEDVAVLRSKAASASDRAAAASEDMPVPSSGNEQVIRRALSRVEAANNEERVLTQRLNDAEAELAKCQGQAADIGSEAAEALLHAYRCFLLLLHGLEGRLQQQEEECKAEVMADDDAEQPAAAGPPPLKARLEDNYQQLRAFARRYQEESSDITERLRELVAGGGADPVPVSERARKEILDMCSLALTGESGRGEEDAAGDGAAEGVMED